MAVQPISIRLDAESSAALARLERSGLQRSEAVRRALVAYERSSKRAQAAADAERLGRDPDDLREVRAIREYLDEISEPW
jgi:hypothetical protein